MSSDDVVLRLIEKAQDQLYELRKNWYSEYMEDKERFLLAADVVEYANEIRDEIRFLWKKGGG